MPDSLESSLKKLIDEHGIDEVFAAFVTEIEIRRWLRAKGFKVRHLRFLQDLCLVAREHIDFWGKP